MTTDILQVEFDWKGQDVYVVGSGPAAAPYMHIPESAHLPYGLPLDANIVACNKGVFCRGLPTVWLCATPMLAKLDWFNKQMRKYAMMPPSLVPMIAGRVGEWTSNYEAMKYHFQPGPSLWSDVKRDPVTNKLLKAHDGFGCTDGYLRGGAGATARGVQLAWFKEATKVILIGSDMETMNYYDGTVNEDKPRTLDKDGNWYELTYFNALIEWVKKRGMEVVSLTPTKLNVEVIDDPD